VASRKWLISTLLTLSLATSVAPAVRAASPIKVGIAYDVGGRGDKAINDAVAMGVDLAKKNLKLTALDVREMVTDGTEKDRNRRLRFLANSGYSTIIAVGAGYEQAVRTVSMEFPQLSFDIIDDGNISNLNVQSLIFDTQQGGYLAGVLAASATKTNKVGFIGDVTFPSSPAQGAAFAQGAKSIKPKISVTITIPLAGSTEATLYTMHTAGIDVIYSNWEKNSDFLDAAIPLNTKKSPLSLIGVLPDQYWLQSSRSKGILIGAFTKHVESAAYDAIWYAFKDLLIGDVLQENPNIYGKQYTVRDAGIGVALVGDGVRYSAAIKSASSLLKAGKIKIASF
jgi:basic membrane protein A